jgi:hypothetical protein
MVGPLKKALIMPHCLPWMITRPIYPLTSNLQFLFYVFLSEKDVQNVNPPPISIWLDASLANSCPYLTIVTNGIKILKKRIGETDMAETKILKTDSRGRVILPPPFRKEPLFEYAVKGDQIILYPVRTVRKYPDMSDLPEEDLSPDWVERERKVNADSRPGIVASTPSKALKRRKK